MSTSFERRTYFRNEILETKTIEYDTGTSTETFEGLIINISDNGMCFFTSNHLSVGQEITLKDFDIYGSSKTAIVQWVEKADERHYKAGAMF
jgi:c-di-GMP-binding flagellar brake protein YcgR